ncbi:MAG: ADP-ribosylglycohydrolase family protein, partial [Promethearchaeota archaeon]
MEKSDLQSKFVGALIGSALGDSIGELAFRFHERNDLISEVSNRTSITYTDDTAMAIGLAESILENEGEIIPEKLGQTFHRNFNREPYRGYGSGPPSIFRTVENTGENYVEVAQRLFEGEGSYGNGASMRITPLGVFFYDSKEIYEIARKSAIVTHSHEYGIDAAAILAKLIATLIPKNPSIYSIQKHLTALTDDLIEFAKTDEYEKSLQEVKDLLNSNAHIKDAERKLGSNVLA